METKIIGHRQIRDINDADKVIRQIVNTVNNLLQGGIPILHLKTHETEPQYVDGETLAAADGTEWNPGSGAGLYYRTAGGAWTKIS